MARACNNCKEYDAAGTLQICPKCQGPMQFTLLPPQNGPVAALAIPEATCQPKTRGFSTVGGSPSAWQLLGLVLRFRLLAGLVLVPFMVVGGFFGLDLRTTSSLKTRYDQIKIGMTISQVENILKPATYYHGRRMPQHPLLDGVPDEGPYLLEYTEDGSGTMDLDFEDGVLVAKSQHGIK